MAPLPSAEHRPRAVLVAGLAQGSFDLSNHGIEGTYLMFQYQGLHNNANVITLSYDMKSNMLVYRI